MKMLYVLSPPRTPPPSPWTSMRDTSPPLSCPSSNSNSSSSINSSCSYASSQSGRESTSTGHVERGSSTSTRHVERGSSTSTRHVERGNNGGRDATESGGGKSLALHRTSVGGAITSTIGTSNGDDLHWNRRLEGKGSDTKSNLSHHIRNSQSEKTVPGREHSGMQPNAKSYAVRCSQSERRCDRDSTLSDSQHLTQHRDSTTNASCAGRDIVCRSKQSKATRIWLNAIAKANARGTVGSGEVEFPAKELRGSTPVEDGLEGKRCEWEADSGEGREVLTPPRHFSKNVRCRLKRKDSGTGTSTEDEETSKPSSRRLSECYFAVALPFNPHPPRVSPASDIQKHLQSMFEVLRPQETLKMAVKLESVHADRTRYLVVVSCDDEGDEACLLGIDCNEATTVGLVLRVLADTAITLDGDGGFSVCVCGRQHIFKPVSVQAMWSALQSLHKVSSAARERNYFLNGGSHEWVAQYEARIASDRSCLNEWHAMDCLESRRPPSPNCLRDKPSQRDQTERTIRSTLKEIIMSVDLDEVTSKYIRSRLEDIMDSDLGEYKSYIDQEMFNILKQMDAATEIFPHVYLGSEWNASNLEELARNGVCHILNVTREIDNFFPGIFDYLNIRVYDDDKTDLLKHWDNTYKYITNAKNQGSKVLVHCKMGISRSASVVIAYAMKAYNWDLARAMAHVRQKRNCIKPNANFIAQLETYQGILDAMKNREKLQRSKSETNLKCKGAGPQSGGAAGPLSRSNVETRSSSVAKEEASHLMLTSDLSESPLASPCLSPLHNYSLLTMPPGSELAHAGSRPKSWSPDALEVSTLFETSAPTSQSLERLSHPNTSVTSSTAHLSPTSPPIPPAPPLPPAPRMYNSNVLMPCGNGLAYSVSQNKVLHLACTQSPRTCEGGVKSRVYALEANAQTSHSDRYPAPVAPSSTPAPLSASQLAQSSFLSQQIASAKHQVESASSKVASAQPKSPRSRQCPNDGSTASTGVVNLTSQFEPNSSQHKSSQQNPSSLSSSSNLVKPSRGIRKYLKFMCKEKSHGSNSTEGKNLPVEKISPAEEKLSPSCPGSSPSGSVQRGLVSNLSRQDSWSSADSAIVSDCVSRQGSWGSIEWAKSGGRTHSLSAGDVDARGCALPPLSRNQSAGSSQGLTSQQTSSNQSCVSIQTSSSQSWVGKQTSSRQAPVSCATSHHAAVPPHSCSCSSTSASTGDTGSHIADTALSVTRKPNHRICNCFRRNSDGEGPGSGSDPGPYLRNNLGAVGQAATATVGDRRGKGDAHVEPSCCREPGYRGSSDTKLSHSKSEGGGTKGAYDSEKIIAATNCISSVILRKKFYSPSSSQSEETHHVQAASCNSHQKAGNSLESMHRQGNSTFYVHNEAVSGASSQLSHRGSNISHGTARSETCDTNVTSDSAPLTIVSKGSKCDRSNLSVNNSAALSVALRGSSSSEPTASSNTLVVSVPPPRRPLSQTLFNYSNSYPQPFSAQSKLKNHHLSRSYPSVRAQHVSLVAQSTDSPSDSNPSTGCADCACPNQVKRAACTNRRSTGSTCEGDRSQDNPTRSATSSFDTAQNLNRVAMASSTQSLHSATSGQLHARRDCPKRSLSVEEKRGKKAVCLAADRKETYGYVKSLRHEFEAKTGASTGSGGQPKRNHSSSSCCSCGTEGSVTTVQDEHSVATGEPTGCTAELRNVPATTKNMNATICDSRTCEDDVFSEAGEKFRLLSSSHEDNSNNNEVPRSQPSVDDCTRSVLSSDSGIKLPVVRKHVRNAASHKSAVQAPVSEHKKSVRRIVGKFEQKTDGVGEPRRSNGVDSVTSLMKYIDDISTRQDGPLVAARVLVDTQRVATDATQELLGAGNNAPPIYNTM